MPRDTDDTLCPPPRHRCDTYHRQRRRRHDQRPPQTTYARVDAPDLNASLLHCAGNA